MRVVKIGAAVAALVVIGLCVALNLGNAPSKAELDQANREAALTLVAGLETFQRAHGVYPTELEELVPGIVAALPAVQPSGAAFEYTVRPDGADFTLGYPEAPLGTLPADAGFEYRASTGTWTHQVY